MTASVDRLRRLITGFTGKTIVVVGDVIIDEYLFGKPARISREAPVVILRFAEREVRLGGAANAAHNVRALGARVQPIGVVGRDAAGDELLGLFHGVGMPTDGLAVETGRVTWTHQTRKAIIASPVVVDQAAYVGSADGSVYALDASSGYQTWATPLCRQLTSTASMDTSSVPVGSCR